MTIKSFPVEHGDASSSPIEVESVRGKPGEPDDIILIPVDPGDTYSSLAKVESVPGKRLKLYHL